ncbi:MAG: glycine oxidase ThiO [Mariprofundaceae bacterium]|nr:glycine oxidase ThiO [Mariprofundaceae bacterium]
MHVAVVGGGIIGCLTACYLKQLDIDVTVVERGETGRESSWAGAGILCPIHPWLYPDAFTHLIDASLGMYPGFQADIEAKTGISIEWVRSGLLIPFFDDDKTDHWQAAIEWSNRFGWQVEELDTKQTLEREPALSPRLHRSLLWPEVGQLRNPRLLAAVRAWMGQLGVATVEHAEVIGLLKQGDAAAGVVCADGRNIESDQVLLAGGSWSGELARQMGFELPVEPVKGQIVLLKGEPGVMHAIVKHDDAYFVPRVDGRILVGASMEHVGFKPGTTDEVIGRLMASMARIAPGLKGLEIEEKWMGFRPGSPDGMPLLGPVTSIPGLWVASGHYRNGVALAPITAKLMSRWMADSEPEMDLSTFAVDRPVNNSPSVGFPNVAL